MIWFTSDFHFGHAMMADYRGFKSIEDHDNAIINNMAKVIKSNDTVFIMGDIAMGGWRNNVQKVKQIPGIKHIIVGNHDRVFAGNRMPHDHMRDFMMLTGATSVMQQSQYQGFVLNHFPYTDVNVAGEAERFEAYRAKDDGKPIIHGHVHSKDRLTVSSKGTPQVHVGVDAWRFKPVSWSQIKQLGEEDAGSY